MPRTTLGSQPGKPEGSNPALTGRVCLPVRRCHGPTVAVLLGLVSGVWGRDPGSLEVLRSGYPRAFFFRASEQAQNARRFPTVESWEAQFNRLQGIMGKCLEEECLGREVRNPAFFSRFKELHPHQAVLLHFNGNSRDPIYRTEHYFPGHWIHRQATLVVDDVPAVEGETTLRVQDARLFRMNAGRYRTSNDDVALFGIAADGRHDWLHCEQTQLVALDTAANTITVRRGAYGSRPLAFAGGQARAAAHAAEGPWGPNNHLLWFYNFAAHCPRDPAGKTAADRLVDDLAEWFGPGGILQAFDGLEFDVMFHYTHGDTTGDGVEDHGVVDGINQYGIGTMAFLRQLRRRLGPAAIIQADGALGPGGSRSQRGFGVINGIESEGWPNLNDWEIADWSGGMNRHFFWRDNAFQPAFSYVNHKWEQGVPGSPGVTQRPEVPWSRHRLVLAACQFFDAVVCYSFAPPNDPDGRLGIWDELRQGAANRLGWLGRPEGPAVRLAEAAPDRLGIADDARALAARIAGDVETRVVPAGVQIAPRRPGSADLRFAIDDIPVEGRYLYVAVSMTGEPRQGYPEEMARYATVGVSGGKIDLMAGAPLETGMHQREAVAEVPLDPATGAGFRVGPRLIAGKTLPAYFVHPPYIGGTGYAFWISEADVPAESSILRFLVGMGEKSPERSDGVWFQVHAAVVHEGKAGAYERIFETSTKAHEWLPQRVSLDAYAGRRIRLKFVADCGPADNATTDHAHWAGVDIVAANADDSRMTDAVSHMTWVNQRPFVSTFHYQQVRSPKVNLSFVVEGPEPVTLRRVTAHCHPDLVYRVFSEGIVLANPSLEPQTFNLGAISPGRSYRRLQAVESQDVSANSGEPVGTAVTLGERDGLFLLRRAAAD